MTTTTIRTLVETTASQMVDEGTITQTQRTAIRNINGHSSQTTEDYYILKDRWTDANNGKAMFDALLGDTNDANLSGTDTMDALPDTPPQVLGNSYMSGTQLPLLPWNRSTSAVKPWGRLHPVTSTSETGAKPRRVQWSEDELQYIATWVQENEGDSRDNKVSRCLAKIRLDPTARGMRYLSAFYS